MSEEDLCGMISEGGGVSTGFERLCGLNVEFMKSASCPESRCGPIGSGWALIGRLVVVLDRAISS